MAALAGVVLSGCDDEPEPDDGPAAVETVAADVAGEYDTRVTLASSTCEGIEVMDNPTTVEQDSADTVTLTHAGTTWHGALTEDGGFTTDAQRVTVGPDTHELSVTGRLADGRLDAEVVVHVTGGQTCEYHVAWAGARS